MKKAMFETGRSSVTLPMPAYISGCGCIAGKKESEGPLAGAIDFLSSDNTFETDNWDAAESKLQKEAVRITLEKSGVDKREIRYLFAGDLLGQSIASSFGLLDFEIPHFGLYGACSTCGESLSLGAMTVGTGLASKVMCVTSSHFASAEKEFRFPLEYGAQRPVSSTWTVTGSGAFLLTGDEDGKTLAKISEITTGRIIDLGVKDSLNMGCAMAPAAADTIRQHLEDFGRKPADYDAIITGDLGQIGSQALIKLLLDKDIDITDKHLDCGLIIFDIEQQDVGSGGSGCGCAAVTLASHILPRIKSGEWNRVLFLPTGALLSKTSFNEGQAVPGIAHAVVLEHVG
nr:stage V sporulation protein AD [Lachnospiraceae bacterium]